MIKAFLLVSCLAVSLSCNSLKNTGNGTNSVNSSSEPNPVTAETGLTDEQNRYLSHSLPPPVREILEKSQKFSLLSGETDYRSGRVLKPTRIAHLDDDALKQQVLKSFYQDVAVNPNPAACYDPHHGISAEYNGQKVEIDICFTCSRIVVRSPFGQFSGVMTGDGRKSEDLFTKILSERGVDLPKKPGK